MDQLSTDDVKAAVGANIITEVQAAYILRIAHRRQGLISDRVKEDEPFDLFLGFNEVFISVGIVLAYVGLSIFGGLLAALATIISGIFIGYYFSVKKRMSLPAITMLILFTISVGTFMASMPNELGISPIYYTLVIALSALLFHYVCKVPSALLIVGVATLLTVMMLGGMIDTTITEFGWKEIRQSLQFDLGKAPYSALGSLIAGAVFFIFAMRFDLRDPYRLTRLSASGFWLHLVAACAIVNPIALTLYRLGTWPSSLVLVLTVLLLAILALVIDRRSFLLSSLAYLMVLLISFTDSTGHKTAYGGVVVIASGVLIIALGLNWHWLRARLLNALPDFRYKQDLPPWQSTIHTESTS